MTRPLPPRRPSTRMFQAVGRLNKARSSLMSAVRDTDTLPELRAAVLELASDIEAFLDGHEPASEIAESKRDTLPCPPPAPQCDAFDVCVCKYRADFEAGPDDSAPCIPVARPSGGP